MVFLSELVMDVKMNRGIMTTGSSIRVIFPSIGLCSINSVMEASPLTTASARNFQLAGTRSATNSQYSSPFA
ncbi:MAG: hypothetical protein A4E33_02153 [Methanoregula sp. PtaB.Bin085]|nr:MAG: hypothetical protein A4E33_02153 [Methanoregula sp. PtaB.Bin085]